ncbi:hypothetical protein [Plantactinospora sp. CA-290183]|uniref:hypothetical protein n=1 Tax=Plantactinospora sp. CA-290183 TaxID=3240006 RepID=UPI003D910FB9
MTTTDQLPAARRRIADIGTADTLATQIHRGDDEVAALPADQVGPDVWRSVADRARAGGYVYQTADIGFTDLHRRLVELLAQVRDGGDMIVLVDTYTQIRAAQDALVQARFGRGQVEMPAGRPGPRSVDPLRFVAIAGRLANLDAVWPEWFAYVRDRDGSATPPWDHPAGNPLEIKPTVRSLRWLATDPAVKPWVPTIDQAKQAFGEQYAEAEARRMAEDELRRDGKVRTPQERAAAIATATEKHKRVIFF